MSTLSTAERPAQAAAATHPTQALLWSVRRELWENRSIYVVPLIAAGVVLIGFVISVTHPLGNVRALITAEPARQATGLIIRLGIGGVPVIVTGLLVAVFYCLDALHGERRDRSILFWKSLPVSDLEVLLSKAAVPLVVLPLVTFATVVVLQLVMLALGLAVLVPSGLDVAAFWSKLPLLRMCGLLLYGLATMAVWHAPIYAWLLLVSGWARRMTFLWAVLPPLALCVIERIAFGSWYLARLLQRRLGAGLTEAFNMNAQQSDVFRLMPEPDVVRFLASPSVWIGLAIAAVFFAAAVRQRRYRAPI